MYCFNDVYSNADFKRLSKYLTKRAACIIFGDNHTVKV